jgi:hypothetical protein
MFERDNAAAVVVKKLTEGLTLNTALCSLSASICDCGMCGQWVDLMRQVRQYGDRLVNRLWKYPEEQNPQLMASATVNLNLPPLSVQGVSY